MRAYFDHNAVPNLTCVCAEWREVIAFAIKDDHGRWWARMQDDVGNPAFVRVATPPICWWPLC